MAAVPSDSSEAQGFSFVAAEEAVLAFWAEQRVFERSLERTADRDPYIFYDGPPFATGLPHHGHLVASTIKDVVPRYWTMKGFHVRRRFGWDCHGLPIEQEINKQLGMSASDAVEKLGVAGYNDECRRIVQRYVSEWRRTITRLGRWVDFDDDYKTMDAWFMESLWWVFRQLWDEDYIYRGLKVVPVSTALGTALSNFEAGLNYKDVQDPAVTVLFRLQDEDACVAAWTTTPWTLPSNLALAVNPELTYARVRDTERDLSFYLAEARVETYAKRHPIEVEATVPASDLIGRRYEPLLPYFAELREQGAFVILPGDYVTTDSGTGVVHQAPAFGEDDYEVFRAAGLDLAVCPVTMEGTFTDEVPDFAGLHVKAADKPIIARLKADGSLYEQDTLVHSYPYCYRSDTPLIYRAVPSWYVRVEAIKDRLLAANEGIHWVPEHIRDGRFGRWLEGARDWAISRSRVWGTPLPVWINDETGAAHCVGSVDELEQLTGVRVTDLHREHVDPLTFTKDGEPGTYRRIEEVLDCWFESGSMPYAQLHYPFENRELFEQGYPAQFIAEGLDQTRGWFYTLHVLSVALNDVPAFRNVIVNGLVLAEDGQKMSKSKRNFTPPDELMDRYGADALRLYLINSGLVRGEEQRFADDGVRDMVRRVLLPWYNAFRFLKTYADIDHWSPQNGWFLGRNVLDRWILSRLQTLKLRVEREMEQYHLYAVVPQLFEFIEELTNWYIRLNRSRFWGEGIDDDKLSAFTTLHKILDELGAVMAPFAPFLAETIHRELSTLGDGPAPERPESVHLRDYPVAERDEMDAELEDAVRRMEEVVLLGRQKREEVRIGVRTPLRRLTVAHRSQEVLDGIAELERYIAQELNVKEVAYTTDETAYARLTARADFKKLGRRLGKRMKAFAAAIQGLDRDAIEGHLETGVTELDGETFTGDEIIVRREAQEGTGAVSNRWITIALDTELDDTLIAEGRAREVVNRLQKARKDAGLDVTDRITVRYEADGPLADAIEAHRDYLTGETLCVQLDRGEPGPHGQSAEVDGLALRFGLARAAGPA